MLNMKYVKCENCEGKGYIEHSGFKQRCNVCKGCGGYWVIDKKEDNVGVDEKTLMYMEEYGGSFVRELAYLYRLADNENKRKLEQCFKDIFERYKNFGKEVSE